MDIPEPLGGPGTFLFVWVSYIERPSSEKTPCLVGLGPGYPAIGAIGGGVDTSTAPVGQTNQRLSDLRRTLLGYLKDSL